MNYSYLGRKESLFTMQPILLVHDEKPVSDLIKIVLMREGFQVVEAEDELGALSTIQTLKGELSLIVSYVFMPRLDGISFCNEVKKEFPNIPVVLISGNRPEACRVGDRFLEKPLYPTILVTAIRELLGN